MRTKLYLICIKLIKETVKIHNKLWRAVSALVIQTKKETLGFQSLAMSGKRNNWSLSNVFENENHNLPNRCWLSAKHRLSKEQNRRKRWEKQVLEQWVGKKHYPKQYSVTKKAIYKVDLGNHLIPFRWTLTSNLSAFRSEYYWCENTNKMVSVMTIAQWSPTIYNIELIHL